MSDLWDVNPHLALAQSESYESPGDRAWYAFVKKAEKLLGHDLDGHQERDGYSMDRAHDWFADGETVEDFVKDVQIEKAARVAMASAETH